MAHKKGGGSSRNGRDSQSKRLGARGLSWYVNEVPVFSLATMWVSAGTILFLP